MSRKHFRIGDRIRYEYENQRHGTGVIRAIGTRGWDYLIELDGGVHADGHSGHKCNGFFKDMVGFFLMSHHIVEVLEPEPESVEIAEGDLYQLLG